MPGQPDDECAPVDTEQLSRDIDANKGRSGIYAHTFARVWTIRISRWVSCWRGCEEWPGSVAAPECRCLLFPSISDCALLIV